MDIKSGKAYPAGALSNFAGHRFTLDGVEIYSMEGFLQSLKFKSVGMQEVVCKKIGMEAKRAGAGKKWQITGFVFWKGKAINRYSKEFQELLDRAYDAMFEQSESFRDALKASGDAVLEHSIGKRDEKETILTRTEFCSRLTRLRDRIKTK